ncbi:MAG: nitroreductase family protein [Bacillota bacterium]
MSGEKEYAFGEPLHEIMNRRVSVRSYTQTPVPSDIKEKITAFFDAPDGPFAPRTRFGLLDKTELKAKENIRLGTYGFIKGAPLFAAAAVEDGERAMEQLGYVFEKLICFITSLGLGTCWLGGSFNRGAFKKAMDLKGNELMPAVAAIGYGAGSRTLVDFAINPSGKKRVRKSWGDLFFNGAFKQALKEQEAGAYALPLEMVRIAPSASNKQPWRVVLENGNYHFYLQHFKPYSNLFGVDIQKVDMGIAMFHFESSAREAGLAGSWQTLESAALEPPENCEYIITWVSA